MAFLMHYHRRGLNLHNDSDVLQYTNLVLELIAKRASPVEQSYYLQQLADEVSISQDVLGQQLRKHLAQNARTENKKPTREFALPARSEMKLDATKRAEYMLMAHLIEDPAVFEQLGIAENMDLFVHDDFTAAFLHLAGFFEKNPAGDFQRLLEVTEVPEMKQLYMKATMMEKDPESGRQEIEDCMRQLRKYRVEKRIEELMHESKLAEKMSDYAKALELAKQAIELKRSIHTV